MTRVKWPKSKVFFLVGIVLLYVLLGGVFKLLVLSGVVSPIYPEEEEDEPLFIVDPSTASGRLSAAEFFVTDKLERSGGHIMLYYLINENATYPEFNHTNSEAVSYYMLWNAKAGNKQAVDTEITFIEEKMLHPKFGYMQWRLEPDGSILDDGRNIASDADLRTIQALLIAEEKWGDKKYTDLIDTLEAGLVRTAITDDNLLAPYGGPAGSDDTWVANEVYISYTYFPVFKELAARYAEPWVSVNDNMKAAVLNAQIYNGQYNSFITQNRQYGNGIDGEGYSINSMWIMVRAAESDDTQLRQSAQRSLDFYKERFVLDEEIYPKYSSEGAPISPTTTPWAYALVARAAIALGDEEFADILVSKLLEMQVADPTSDIYGAFPEGYGTQERVGQFTMQESILTLQDYLSLKGN